MEEKNLALLNKKETIRMFLTVVPVTPGNVTKI